MSAGIQAAIFPLAARRNPSRKSRGNGKLLGAINMERKTAAEAMEHLPFLSLSLSLTHASFLFSPLFVAKYLRPAKGQSRSRMSDRQNDAIFSAIILGLIFPQSSLSRPLSTRQCADLNECVCVFLHLCYS